MALTPGEAAMVLHNFENQTGHIISIAELESGFLKGQLHPEDYDIKQWVHRDPPHNFNETAPKCSF